VGRSSGDASSGRGDSGSPAAPADDQVAEKGCWGHGAGRGGLRIRLENYDRQVGGGCGCPKTSCLNRVSDFFRNLFGGTRSNAVEAGPVNSRIPQPGTNMESHKEHQRVANPKQTHYNRLLLMAASSFLCMYFLMYAMVDRVPNAYLNVNQLYMAGLMTAPMIVIELILMSAMYHNRRLNLAIAAISLIAGLGFWVLIRQQVAIGDRQFLRSMIPHHAGALLMCEKAPISDPVIRDLCRRILASQQSEIDEMRARLAALSAR
jgi:hypothetical protein